jgi:hypothetical protein
MIGFKIREVLAGWRIVSIGGSDHIEYYITADDEIVHERYDCLRPFLKLYECVVKRIATQDHPAYRSPIYIENMIDNTIRVSIQRSEDEVVTTFDELEEALQEFLRELFIELNELSDSDMERTAALQKYNEYLIENGELYYDRVMTNE